MKVQKDLGEEGIICALVNEDFLTNFIFWQTHSPRHTASSLDIETVDADENYGSTATSSVHQPVNPRGQSFADKVLPIMRQALAKMDSSPQVINTPVKYKTKGQTFAELICTMLENIKESFERQT